PRQRTAGLRPGRRRGHSGRCGARGMVPRRHRGDRFLRASARRLPTRRQTRLHQPRLNSNQERAAVGKSAALAVTDLLLERPTCWTEAPMLSSTMLRAPVRLMATMLVAQLALGSRADG